MESMYLTPIVPSAKQSSKRSVMADASRSTATGRVEKNGISKNSVLKKAVRNLPRRSQKAPWPEARPGGVPTTADPRPPRPTVGENYRTVVGRWKWLR